MLKTFLMALCLMAVCFVLDGIWLGVIAKPFYHRQIGGLMHESPLSDPGRIVSVLFVYTLIVSAVLIFVVFNPSALHPFWKGALLGLVIYGVYDGTNYAILKGWTFPVSVLDVAWGSFLCGVLGWAGNLLARKWLA